MNNSLDYNGFFTLLEGDTGDECLFAGQETYRDFGQTRVDDVKPKDHKCPTLLKLDETVQSIPKFLNEKIGNEKKFRKGVYLVNNPCEHCQEKVGNVLGIADK